jgi:hypothetical protein
VVSRDLGQVGEPLTRPSSPGPRARPSGSFSSALTTWEASDEQELPHVRDALVAGEPGRPLGEAAHQGRRALPARSQTYRLVLFPGLCLVVACRCPDGTGEPQLAGHPEGVRGLGQGAV